MTELIAEKRVTCKRPHPNPVFHNWLESLYENAVESQSSIVPVLEEAIASLAKYPLPLSSGAECAILKGFDHRLCKYIDLNLSGHIFLHKKSKVTNKDLDEQSKSFNEYKQVNSQILPSASRGSSLESLEPEGPNPIISNMAPSKKDHKKRQYLLTNTDTDKISKDKETLCCENLCSLAEAVDTYFVNTSKKDTVRKKKCKSRKEKGNVDKIDTFITLTDESESYSSDIDEGSKKVNELGKTYKPTLNNNPIDIESTSNTDNEIDCFHDEHQTTCKQCEHIAEVADIFQSYYKDKVKKDAEETQKCVLPRKLYKPVFRSGGYAILVALMEQYYECPYREYLTKKELIEKAQKHTDELFTEPKVDSNYTAWSNAMILLKKGMIEMSTCKNLGPDITYTLTAMGRAVATELLKEHIAEVTVNDIIFHGRPHDRVPSVEDVVIPPPPPLVLPDEELNSDAVFIEMPPGTFDIILLIDKHENFNKSRVSSYCKYEFRSFTVGDFLWVARSKKTGQELVLPFIVERKRMDDLASSIKDGRFHEQKFRLRKCGLEKVIYLIESYNKNKHVGLPMSTLMQALVNTSVHEEFQVVQTDSLNHTFQFLGMLSERLVHQHLPQFLRGCNRDTGGRELMTFEYFNKFSSKNKALTVKDTFIKMLLQLKGLSVEKALAITNKYNTPKTLMRAYERCSEKEGELLLANLKFNIFTRNVGPAVSKTIYQLFSGLDF